jgi:hypothetical protein
MKIELADIRQAMNNAKLQFTLRQWARSNATFIHKIASAFDLQGDLAKKLQRANYDLNRDDSYWASNFQMDNSLKKKKKLSRKRTHNVT